MEKKHALHSTLYTVSQAEIGRRCGVHRSRIGQICRQSGWPHGNGPWTSEQAEAVVHTVLSRRKESSIENSVSSMPENPNNLSLEKKAKITLITKRISLLEFKLKFLRKEYIPVADHKQAMIQIARTFIAWLDRLPTLADILNGRPTMDIRRELEKYAFDCRTALSSHDDDDVEADA